VVFAVRDTGIGIALEDREMIFEEFAQVPNALQRRVKGTGLGLPLCRKLATLLGGQVHVESEPGVGSTFYAEVLARHRVAQPESGARASRAARVPPEGEWVLLVEDDAATRLLHEKFLKGTRFQPFSVSSLAAALEILKHHRPRAVVLDILLPGEEEQTWRWLSETKGRDDPLPVIVASQTCDERKAYSLGVDVYFHKPVKRDELIDALDRLTRPGAERVALIIDDDPAARYVIRHSLRPPMRFEEASDGASGLAAASRLHPGVIFLDLSMPGMQGDDVLERLGSDPATAAIPVVVVTSRDIDPSLRARLAGRARAIVHKRDLSVETLELTMTAIGRGAPAP
jgi:CheY-like chemotaxis protein